MDGKGSTFLSLCRVSVYSATKHAEILDELEYVVGEKMRAI
jgi:hypothetical protein